MEEEAILKKILNNVEKQIRSNNVEGFKSAVKDLVGSALKVTKVVQKKKKICKEAF